MKWLEHESFGRRCCVRLCSRLFPDHTEATIIATPPYLRDPQTALEQSAPVFLALWTAAVRHTITLKRLCASVSWFQPM